MVGRPIPLHAWRIRLLTALLAAAVAAAVAGFLVPSYSGAADQRVIAAGVSSDGVDLSGLTVDAAAQKLLSTLVPTLNRPVVVGVAGKQFRLAPGHVKLAVDAPKTAARAYNAGQSAHGAPVSVALAVTYDQASLAAWVAAVAKRVDAPAKNATITIGLTHLYLHHSQTGHQVAEAPLAKAIAAAIASPTASRVFHVALQITHPTVDAKKLALQYETVVTVDRDHFRLRLFKSLHEVVSYPIAVGMAGLETPTGIYHVLEREVNPSWHVPNSPWAGALAGQTIPPGPSDPIVARWLGLGGGVGIHGTNEPFSIGSRASHGCIRMLVPDVIKLYPRVPLGTTVYIK